MWIPNNYGTRTCVLLSNSVPRVKYVSSWYNLRDSCLSSACAAWLARGTQGVRTLSTPNGTRTCLLMASCSNFGCSVRVQLKHQSQLAVRASTGGLRAFLLVNIVRDTQGRRTIFMDRTIPVGTYGGCWTCTTIATGFWLYL
jgi:hypothetical protein